MKKLLLIFLFPIILQAQLLTLFSGDAPEYFALDYDGVSELVYINEPNGLDLNSPNYLSGDNTAFTSTVGDWVGLDSVSGGKGFFSNTASISQSNLSSAMEHGKNYTVQLKASSLASSDLKVKVGTDSTTKSTTGTETTYAYTFTYDSTGMTAINENFNNDNGSFVTNSFDYLNSAWKYNKVVNGGSLRTPYNKTEIGKTYHVRFDIYGVAEDSIANIAHTWGGIYGDFTNGIFDSVMVATNTYFQIIARNTGTYGTFYVDNFLIEELPDIQLIGNGTDTYTTDDVDVSERRDASYDGYVKLTDVTGLQRILSNRSSNLGFEIYTANASEVLTLSVGGGAGSVTPTITYNLTDNTWHHYVIDISGNTITANMDGVSKSLSSSSIATVGAIRSTNLSFGAISTPANYLNGELGLQTITVGTSTSIYDWKGTADTFLDDKGTNGNDLVGVNTTIDDQVKYKGAYK